MTDIDARASAVLPDNAAGSLAARVWLPAVEGPAVAAVRPDGVFDVSASFPTIRDLCERPDPATALATARGEALGPLDAILANTPLTDAIRAGPGCSRRSTWRRSRPPVSRSPSRCWSG